VGIVGTADVKDDANHVAVPVGGRCGHITVVGSYPLAGSHHSIGLHGRSRALEQGTNYCPVAMALPFMYRRSRT
jgi:hypothetical protein